MPARSTWATISLLLLPGLISAAEPAPARSRPIQLTFTQRSPHSGLENVLAKMDIDLDRIIKKPKDADAQRAIWQYDISQHPFDVVIPAGYKRDVPHGLLVWMGNVEVPSGWLEVLAKEKLIVVTPVETNERMMPVAAGLALDAVYNMTRRYTISPQRIYVAGYSAGAQRAAWVLRAFPDVFRGGIFIMGGWFYRVEPSFDKWFFEDDWKLVEYAADIRWLDPQWKGAFEKLKSQVKIVLVRGENDDFFKHTVLLERAQYEGLRLDGFLRAHYLEIPAFGHAPPDAGYFEKAVMALEAPPGAPPTTGPTKSATPHGDQVAHARRMLTTAQHGQGMRVLCERILKEYPTTPSAPMAQRGLDYLDREEKKPRR